MDSFGKLFNLQNLSFMFTFIIALLLQLGTITSAADFNPNEYDQQSSTYQQDIIIKDEIVY